MMSFTPRRSMGPSTLSSRRRTTATMMSTRISTTLLVLLALTSTLPLVQAANQDPNVYSFGQNPNLKYHKMYWADSKAVLDDLDEFSALYIKFHSCAWSPNQAFYDDDGEGRDGDENWYQGRSPYYAANAGFSLYGSRNALFGSFTVSGCSKASYINSFFTNNGADVLLEALGIDEAEEGLGYCQGYNGGDNQNYQNQQQDDNDNNNDNSPVPQSSMMGCDANGEFAMALFSDEYCQGKYFVNISNTMDGDNADAIRTYNQVMHNRLDCKKIWHGKAQETDNGFQSQAHEVLQQATVCDIRISPTCPDPYGIKTRYAKAFHLAQTGRSTFFDMVIRKPMWVVSNLALVIGTILFCATYAVQHRTRILQTQAKEPNRTWLRAFFMVAYKDFRTSLKRARKARRAARAAKLLQRKRRRERRGRRGSRSGSRSGRSASSASRASRAQQSHASESQLQNDPTFDSDADGSGGMFT